MSALELQGIRKRFGPVHALRGVDFSLAHGEVHALLGENGAGKSTLMHVAYGLLQPDQGTIEVNAQRVRVASPRDARRLGIGMVHQHFTSIPAFTVLENIALSAGWRPSSRESRLRAREVLDRSGLALDLDARTSDLGVTLLQRLEVVKALAGQVGILLLDEPTAALGPQDKEDLLGTLRQLAGGGTGVVLITHKLDEALGFADRVTVLRKGLVTFTGAAAGMTESRLAGYMIDAETARATRAGGAPRASDATMPAAVRAQHLTVPPADGRGPGLRDVSLTIFPGEVVGVAAIEGNGERELLRAVAGRVRPASGLLEVRGPVAFVPGNRTTEGLILEFSLAENLTLGLGHEAPWIRRGLVNWNAADRRTAAVMVENDIQAASPAAAAGTLSGGNQQKLVLARAMFRGREGEPGTPGGVLVAENPTRGLDFRAALTVFQRLRSAASRGTGVLMYSNDLDEVLQWSDRILVVAGGRISEMRADAAKEVLGLAMLGGPGSDAPEGLQDG
ncbi:MAG: ABC transporter ATP-binding protein [Gemmatimonadales bacterium]